MKSEIDYQPYDNLSKPLNLNGGVHSNVHDLIVYHASVGPDAPALLAPGRRSINYGHLLDQVDRVSAYLFEMGISAGDSIVIVLPNGPSKVLEANDSTLSSGNP